MSPATGQFSGSTAVDLSKLPFPGIVEPLSFDVIVQQTRDALVAQAPELATVLDLPSEALVEIIEIFAYRELILRQRINDAARDLTLAHATGASLDNLTALLGVQRLELAPADPDAGTPAVMEADEDFRRRAVLAPEAWSVAGPVGAYVSHALNAHPLVADAGATSPAPGEVTVTVLSREDGGAASPDLLAAVDAALSADDIRPLTDLVRVVPAELIDFELRARITTFPGPDSGLALAEARRRLDLYLAGALRLGRDVTLSGLLAALHAEGVHNVDLLQPNANLIIDARQAARCTAIDLVHEGLGE